MRDIDIRNWIWAPYSAYNRWYVIRKVADEGSGSTYGDQLGPFGSKKLAEQMANALNWAFDVGRAYAARSTEPTAP